VGRVLNPPHQKAECVSGSHNHPFSRRGFLKAAASATQLDGTAAAAPEPSPFRPHANLRRISENLYVLEDTCNVYLIRDGSRGVLIDFGSGAILSHLAALGVTKIDWILHTHHHRDQAQGDSLAVAQRIPIAVPVHERHLFENVENFWRNRRVFELYDCKNDFFSLTRNVPIGALLRDYESFRWNQRSFFVQPTPGHTPGSITLITEVDGRKVAFAGDLMHSPGKVQTLYDLQYYYAEHEGVDLSFYSLEELIKLKPALLCPSHGVEVADPIPGMQQLAAKLHDWWHFWHVSPLTSQQKSQQLTPHIIAHPQATSTFYAIISSTGKALFIDYGCGSWSFFQAFLNSVEPQGRIRFVEHSIDALRAKHGLKTVDIAIPTHMHDDHLNGFPHLARRYGTKVWAYENMTGILENPRSRNLGCILGEPIRVDRPLHSKETFRWEEFEFTAVHSPGHTNYQMALFADIDGTRLAFTGDAFFAGGKPDEMRHNLVYRNEVKSGDHLASIRNILDFEPHLIAPGHGEPFAVTHGMAEAFATKMKRQDTFFADLIADTDTDIGLDPAWVHLVPYQALATPGQSRKFELRVRNLRRRPIKIQAAMVLPQGWSTFPARLDLTIAPGTTGVTEFTIRIPTGWRSPYSRVAIAADIIADGRYLGQIAEAVVDVRHA
jgi:glyoxylase-like metal-dependent hydrolase (beta-lactamase superfamily II)